ncbi:MAG: glycine C-acetyltransferase [Polyangiaceae bacterium]|nr:glycine C-acetyltransferase [Polyangiaceae bacterium]MCW5791720.1 glycine C-acetyltransferase [Polyangiaceae bacterium]
MFDQARSIFQAELDAIQSAGLLKSERIITTPQGALVTSGGKEVINLCANNYLGLASHPQVIAAAKAALDSHGFGLSSVRFICGTQDLHRELEQALSTFFGTEDTILYSSCFDANGGLFETLLGEGDVIISDALNHASIIDGIRLSKAARLRYPNGDLGALEAHLQASQDKRLRLIATDGVFSMDGYLAQLDRICDLAERYGAMVMVDDSHATGFVGPTGRGTPEHFGVQRRVDIMTSTLGKALGGASGGFTTGRRELIALLRQRSRPYLFSNTLAPAICGASLAVLTLLEQSGELREALVRNAASFRSQMSALGFTLKPGSHAIVPVMMQATPTDDGEDARLATRLSELLLERGIYVVGFSYPVVPRGAARIRVQLSAVHTPEQIDAAVAAFADAGRQLGLIG